MRQRMTTAMVPIHRKNRALIHIASALSQEEHASSTTATTAAASSCNGRILWRRINTICYVG